MHSTRELSPMSLFAFVLIDTIDKQYLDTWLCCIQYVDRNDMNLIKQYLCITEVFLCTNPYCWSSFAKIKILHGFKYLCVVVSSTFKLAQEAVTNVHDYFGGSHNACKQKSVLCAARLKWQKRNYSYHMVRMWYCQCQTIKH